MQRRLYQPKEKYKYIFCIIYERVIHQGVFNVIDKTKNNQEGKQEFSMPDPSTDNIIF